MRVMLATLCLNEMGWLPRLYEQHRHWPGLVKWIFVEAVDRIYAETNPHLITEYNLSVDGTTEYLMDLAVQDPSIYYIPFGLSSHADIAQGKCRARNAYMEEADRYHPDIVIVVDADEFYTLEDQIRINQICSSTSLAGTIGFCFRQRHIWWPPSIQTTTPLFTHEVIGGYWAVPHVRVWSYRRGMRYTNNHNSPTPHRNRDGMRWINTTAIDPQCVHMGFASPLALRKAKHNYYVARGEGKADNRQMYVDCRASWQVWQPDKSLPHGSRVIHYDGPIPEVFL